MAAVAITSYNELCAAAASWLNRADLTDQIPAFIMLAEAQFNREMRTRDMMVRADCTSSHSDVALPADFLEHYSLVLAPGTIALPPLRYMSERETNQYKANSPAGGTTFGYTLIGNAFELVFAPTANVNLKMVYYAKIPNLGAAQVSNWLLVKSPDLYLYSTLLQAEPYLKNDARLQMWIGIRAALLESIRLESEAALRPGSNLTARATAL